MCTGCSKVTHLAWQRSEKELANVKYSMGADPTAKVSEDNGLNLRGSFFIGPEGRLMGSEMNFYNLGRNIDEQLRKFKANIYMAKKGGNEVCRPSGRTRAIRRWSSTARRLSVFDCPRGRD